MTQDTNTTSGAADLPEALKHAECLESFAEHLPAYGFDSKPLKEAAATIRRLHALLEAEDAAHCNTIEQRDEAEKLGTMLANAVAEHFRIEVGEYSNLNDPRLVALEILGGGYITDSDADRKIAALAAVQATAAQQPAPSAACPVGNSDFDHQTAADVLNGKTVSDEVMRKFVAASRWAHDDRVGLRATLLSVRGELASREAEIALLKKALMDAEAPRPSPAAQGDALDAARLDWLQTDFGCRVFNLGKSWYTRANFGMPYRKRASLREAIDAARAAQEGK